MSVPIWLFCIYGVLEISAFVIFIITVAGLKIDMKKIAFMVVILLAITITVRYTNNNYLILLFTTLFFNVLIIKLFYKYSNILKLIIGTVLAIMILILTETFFTIKLVQAFKDFNEIHLWILTGIPHIILIVLTTVAIRMIKNVVEKNQTAKSY